MAQSFTNGIFQKTLITLSPTLHALQCNLDILPIERLGYMYPNLDLGGFLSALRGEAMLGNFQGWVIKPQAVSTLCVRTLEPEVMTHHEEF